MRQREEDIVCYLVVQDACIILNLVLEDSVELGQELVGAFGPVWVLLAL